MAADRFVKGTDAPPPWSQWLALVDLAAGPVSRSLVADEAARVRIAEALDLDRLDSLSAEVRVMPWLDGASLEGRWSASIEQTCGVTLEIFGTELEGAFSVRVLPRTSRHAPQEPVREIAIDPDAEDAPDLLDEDRIDLADYVVEHLALEIDPFPRKPGVEFTAPDEPGPASPFAVLRDFKAKSGDD